MPVAALIVVGPGIEVKPVKGDSLRADWNHGEERTNVAIEAIFVHAEIGRGVAQPDEARQQPGWLGKEAQLLWKRTSCEGMFRSSTTLTNLWFRPFRDKLSRVEIIPEMCKKVGLGFALFSAELKQSRCEHQRPTHPASVAMKVPLEAATVLDSFATDSYCEHGTVS